MNISAAEKRERRTALLVDDPCYTTKEAAAYCRCSAKTLMRRNVPREILTLSSDGKHNKYVYRRSTLNQFIRSQGRPLARSA